MIPLENHAKRKSLEPYIPDSVTFYQYQADAIRQLLRWKSFLLADDPGLGKSLQALTVFACDVIREWASTCIIVAPVTLKGNWCDEIEKFTTFKYIALEGTPSKRVALLEEFARLDGPKILVVNYEQVKPHLEDFNAHHFDVAIFDEAHAIKNPKAARTEACLSLYSRRSFILTGTPMLNQPNDLWVLLHRINSKAFPNYWRFVNRHIVWGGYKNKQIVGVKNEAELREKLQSVMVRRLKKDVLDMKEPHIIQRRADLHGEQRKIYKEIVEEMRVQRAGSDEPEYAENALTQFLRLKQVCGTTFPFTGNDDSAKLDLATAEDAALILNGEKIIVFTQFRDILECYATRMSMMSVPVFQLHGGVKKEDRNNVVKSWSKSKEPGIIACMLQVAGVGLNLVAASQVSFLDKLFVPGLNKQAIDRAHRIGQTEPVIVREYICKGTIEQRIEQINNHKKKLNDTIVENHTGWQKLLMNSILEDEES